MDDASFSSLENMQRCLEVFQKYMYNTFNIDVIQSFPEINARVVLLETMRLVFSNYQEEENDMSLNELNNIVMNKMKQFYVKKFNLTAMDKPVIKTLERDKEVMGDRPVMLPPPIAPESHSLNDKTIVEKDFNRILDMRQLESHHTHRSLPGGANIFDPIKESPPLDQESFEARLRQLRIERGEELFPPEPSYVPPTKEFKERQAEKAGIHNSFIQPSEYTPEKLHQSMDLRPSSHLDNSRLYETKGEGDFVIKQPKTKVSSPYYFVINGFDRNWLSEKMRFQFRIDTSQFTKQYKNILELCFTKLIIPAEIKNEKTMTNPVTKLVYNHNFSLSYPYLILKIDEIKDNHDGINQQNQHAFTHFIQDGVHTSANGRDYIILKPMQNETKVFSPSPLSSLPKFSIQITKPNGMLFNHSTDNFSVWKVEYEEYNKQVLKIVLNKFFDKNEFYVGDTINCKDFMIPVFDKESEDLENNPAYNEFINHSYTYRMIRDFINRSEGHTILELGKPNMDGYYRNFYIQAPGDFDADNGKYVVNKELVDRIRIYNSQNFPDQLTTVEAGRVINSSIQITLAMQLKTSITDAQPFVSPSIV